MTPRGATRRRARTGTAATIAPRLLRAWPLPDPGAESSKEERGQVLVVGGSREIPGSALLAAEAAMRAGAGKLQVATARPVAGALAIAMPEARVIALAADRAGEIAKSSPALADAAAQADAVLVGPGMRSSAASRRVAAALLRANAGTVVLDAGTLGAFAGVRDGARLVLTPHAGEMAALLGIDVREVEADAPAIAARFAREAGVVLVLKGATTHVAAPDGRRWINTGGSVGLGTSGSGDVLAGIIAGLAARGAPPEQAAVWGVHLHAAAGAMLARRLGRLGLLAREIAAEVPPLMARLQRKAG